MQNGDLYIRSITVYAYLLIFYSQREVLNEMMSLCRMKHFSVWLCFLD